MKVFDVKALTPQGPAGRDQQAFLLAVEFHESAIRAFDTTVAPNGKPICATIPGIVSYAFAAELYLKSLAGVGTGPGPIKGHRLNILYARLDGGVRAEIANRFQRRTGRGPGDLAKDLQDFGQVFQEWRYVYEGDGLQVRVNLLVAFTQGLFETARSIFPDWAVDPWQEDRFRAMPDQPSMTMVNLGGGTFLHVVDGTGGTLNTPEA
ncbi:MAG: hypothetical protein PSX79_01390 [bacterium]|nr:hypothetical protein [bacterium]